jgi:hypothetical protein
MLTITSFNNTFTGPAPQIGTGDFSLDVWVKTSASYGYFLDTRGSSTSNAGWMAGMYGGRPLLQLNSGGHAGRGMAHNYLAPIRVADGGWHLVTFSIDRDVNVTIYVDRAEVLSEPARYIDADLTGSMLTLGSAIDPTPFLGQLDDIELVRHARSGGEVAQRFDAGAEHRCLAC